MKESYILTITEEQANYLQRLGMEVDSKSFLIDRMFANHANDEDTLLFSSAPFKYYEKEFEKAFFTYEQAKTEFEKTVLKPWVREKVGEDVGFSWRIDDFLTKEVEIEIV